MSETTNNLLQQTNHTEEMCHCTTDISTEKLADEYNLPIVNRGLMMPVTYYWQNIALSYYQMFEAVAYADN